MLGGKTAGEIAEFKRIRKIPAKQSNRVANKVDPLGVKRQKQFRVHEKHTKKAYRK
ncbi:hypothetical protein AAEX28_01685 [Lentisphaerota bacterium WC36G]|nr:hypothetical protein LJT99_04570 [Lentisphaerae bacterium WC36]